MLSFQLAHISNQSCKYTTVYNYNCDWNNFVAFIKDEQPRCATVKGELKTSQQARSQSTSVSRPSNPDPAFPNPQINPSLATPTRLGRHAGHTQGVVLLGANIGAIWCPHHQRCKHTRKRGLNKPEMRDRPPWPTLLWIPPFWLLHSRFINRVLLALSISLCAFVFAFLHLYLCIFAFVFVYFCLCDVG